MKCPKFFCKDPNIDKIFIDDWVKNFNLIGVNREEPFLKKFFKNSKYAIWSSGPSFAQSAWNEDFIMAGEGWVHPYDYKKSDFSCWRGKNAKRLFKHYLNSKIKQKSVSRKLKGDFIAFHTIWHDNYGHILHDHLPYLFWLISKLPSNYKILLLKSDVREKILYNISRKLYNKCEFINIGETIEVDGSLVVSSPDKHPCIMGDIFWSKFKDQMKDNFINNPKDVIFYSRKGTTPRRVLDEKQEALIIQKIIEKMSEHRIDCSFKIFTGQTPEGKNVDIKDQINVFQNAHTVIGPHGSGLINFLWSNLNIVKVLEFIPSIACGRVQRPFNGYFQTTNGLNLDYNQIFYTNDSNEFKTKIDLFFLEQALDSMWGKNE